MSLSNVEQSDDVFDPVQPPNNTTFPTPIDAIVCSCLRVGKRLPLNSSWCHCPMEEEEEGDGRGAATKIHVASLR